MSATVTAIIFQAARLFPGEEVVRHARIWLRKQGRDFLGLAPSQIGALRASVAGAETVEQFDSRLEAFKNACEKRGGKAANPWRRETEDGSLADRLITSFDTVVANVCRHQQDPANEAFARICERIKEPNEAAKAQEARDLAIRKDLLDALVRFHQAQEYYPFKSQDEYENGEEEEEEE